MVIFLCGTPAAGKSEFGKYLKTSRSYHHFDMEISPWPDEPLHRTWDLIFMYPNDPKRVADFVSELTHKYPNSVLDLGFPVGQSYFRIIKALKKLGCEVIWFECDFAVARERYTKRNPNDPLIYFDKQIQDIKNNWGRILSEVNPKIVNVLVDGINNKPPEKLYEEAIK